MFTPDLFLLLFREVILPQESDSKEDVISKSHHCNAVGGDGTGDLWGTF